MTIKSLIIPFVEGKYTAEYIANTFWYEGVARVNRITLLPNLYQNQVFFIAYVDIEEWFDSEYAYNFINNLKNLSNVSYLYHTNKLYWTVGLNTHNSGNIYLYSYSTDFPKSYFIKEDEDYHGIDDFYYLKQYFMQIQDSDSEDEDDDDQYDFESCSNSRTNSECGYAQIHSFDEEQPQPTDSLQLKLSNIFDDSIKTMDSLDSIETNNSSPYLVPSSSLKSSTKEQQDEWTDLNHEIKKWEHMNYIIMEMVHQNPTVYI